jgi:hypothetical protein
MLGIGTGFRRCDKIFATFQTGSNCHSVNRLTASEHSESPVNPTEAFFTASKKRRAHLRPETTPLIRLPP